ncbi:MAG: adenylate/guanylate cyclase domain-containing protein, partial [Acidimicrobiales bacterium]
MADELEALRQEVARLQAIVEAQQALLDSIADHLGMTNVRRPGSDRGLSDARSDEGAAVDDDLWRRLGLAEGERRMVTVLFADVSGYTELAERLDPEETQLVMRDTMAALAGCVQRHDGYLEKFIGDALCAIFGAPLAHEDEPKRAARAALEMHRMLAERAARRPDLPGLTVHIGINTGIVIAGTVGDGSQFGVMGDTINTAARLMGMAASGQTFVAAETARRLRRQFRLADKGLHRAKGKAHPVAVFEVTEEVPGGVGRGGTHLDAPLVDRQDEVGALVEELERAASHGQGATLVVTGEAGVGKSRVVGELVERASERWRVVRSSARLAGDQPFALLAGALAPLVNELADGADKAVAAALSNPTGAVPPDFEIVLARVVSAAASRWPLLVVLEDVDRADEGSIELSQYLSRATVDEAVVWLLVARRAPGPFMGHEGATITRLQPLDDEATAALFDALLPGALNTVQRARLARRADGNPTFATEIAHALIDDGVVVERDDGGWRLVGDPEAMQIPGSVTELIEARIDGMATAARATLQEASVIGARFRLPLLERVSSVPSSLPAALAELETVDLIVPPAADDEYWSFRSHLVREVAYQSILRRRRPAAHRAVADALLDLEPDRIDENAELLAHHYASSDEPALALPFLGRGLSHAVDAHSTAGAAAIARRAIAIATRHPDEIDTAQLAWFHERLGVCRFLLGEPDGAESLVAAVAVHESRGDDVKVAQGAERVGWYLTLLGDPAGAAEHLARAERLATQRALEPATAAGVRAAVA